MKSNPNEKSTFSFKEMFENKEPKKEYLMPPPRTPLRSAQNYIQKFNWNTTKYSTKFTTPRRIK